MAKDSNTPFIARPQWEKHYKGWHIVDCAVRDRNIVYLVARPDLDVEKQSSTWDHDIGTRLLSIYLDEQNVEKRHGWSDLDGFNRPRCGVSRKPIAQALVVARNNEGSVYSIGGGKPGAMERIGTDLNPITQRVKCIDGYAYSVGRNRKIFKRVAVGRWERLEGLPKPGEGEISDVGFNDMDGLSEKELYAVGAGGDVWRCEGKKWTRCDFPSNEQLGTVTVGPDGKVYISGEGGNLWIGSKDTWKQVYKGESSLLNNSSVWFENQLWLCSDYQLRVWDGKEVRRPQHNGVDVVYTGHMDAYDGLLVIASLYDVNAYDGKSWKTLVAPYS